MPYSNYAQDSTEIRISTLNVDHFNKTPHRGYEFESVRLQVNSAINRKLTLVNDTNTVHISAGNDADSRRGRNYDDYGMPILKNGFNFYCIISLDKYYLNQKTGRIATGQKWLDRKGPKRMSLNADQFLLVSPSIKYLDDDNNQYLGSELIDKGRVKLKRFIIEDFISTDKENIPYCKILLPTTKFSRRPQDEQRKIGLSPSNRQNRLYLFDSTIATGNSSGLG